MRIKLPLLTATPAKLLRPQSSVTKQSQSVSYAVKTKENIFQLIRSKTNDIHNINTSTGCITVDVQTGRYNSMNKTVQILLKKFSKFYFCDGGRVQMTLNRQTDAVMLALVLKIT